MKDYMIISKATNRTLIQREFVNSIKKEECTVRLQTKTDR